MSEKLNDESKKPRLSGKQKASIGVGTILLGVSAAGGVLSSGVLGSDDGGEKLVTGGGQMVTEQQVIEAMDRSNLSPAEQVAVATGYRSAYLTGIPRPDDPGTDDELRLSPDGETASGCLNDEVPPGYDFDKATAVPTKDGFSVFVPEYEYAAPDGNVPGIDFNVNTKENGSFKERVVAGNTVTYKLLGGAACEYVGAPAKK